jgi:hypothetical protein
VVVFIPEKLCENLADCHTGNRFQYPSDLGKSAESGVFLDFAVGVGNLPAFLFWNIPASPFAAYRKYAAAQRTYSNRAALVGYAFVLFLWISF